MLAIGRALMGNPRVLLMDEPSEGLAPVIVAELGRTIARLQAIAGAGGCHACHSHQSCQELCPQALNPTAAIAALKRRTAAAYLKGEIKV